MGDPSEREALNSAAADYVRRLRDRLVRGRQEIDRQKAVLSENREHIDEVARWREETERQLRADRERLRGSAA